MNFVITIDSMQVYLYITYNLLSVIKEHIFSLRFSQNSEAKSSELLRKVGKNVHADSNLQQPPTT